MVASGLTLIPGSVLLSITSTGGTGTATSAALRGLLSGVWLNYHADADAGTDVLIEYVSPNGETVTLLALSNVKTDGYYPIMFEAVGPTGAALGQYQPFTLTNGVVRVTISNDGSVAARAAALKAEIYVM